MSCTKAGVGDHLNERESEAVVREVSGVENREAWVERFHRDGYLIVRGVLTPEEVARLRESVVRAFAEPQEGYENSIVRVRLFERGPEFEALIDHPGVIDLIEAILGPDCHLIAQNAVMNPPGKAIDAFHTDMTVRFPRPADVPLDPRVPMPCFVLNMNYYLTDVTDVSMGPTQFVPGSHRAGRQPDPDQRRSSELSYEGRGIVSALGRAGDCVMWNDQIWHRGAPNTSDRTRIVQQGAYGKRFIAQMFYPFVNYHMPEAILERANPRRKRLLGLHPKGAYG
jgi:ectoine hydroxylase-related dioxygenase (phytanoyl-CoA dioxygenase family)